MKINLQNSKCIGCGQTLKVLGSTYLACKCMWIALKDKLSEERKFDNEKIIGKKWN